MSTLLFSDEFNGTAINTSNWALFNSPNWWPATAANSTNVSISNGSLHLMVSRNPSGSSKPYTGCGLDNSPYAPSGNRIKTGYWECSVRAPPSNLGIVPYICLWPNPEQWPPEVDFFEENGMNSNTIYFTQHWGSNNQTQNYILSIDPTQWHTYGVEITPDSSTLNWYVDGQKITSQPYHATGQTWKFSLGIWAGNCSGVWGGCPTSTSLPRYLDLDYVRIWDTKPIAQNCNNFVFVHGGDNALWYKKKENDRYTFDNWTSLGGNMTSKPVSSIFQNNPYVLYKGGNNGLWGRYLGSSGWSNEFTLGGGLLSFPIITTTLDKIFVFVKGNDYQLYFKSSYDGLNWYPSNTGPWYSLGGMLHSEPTSMYYQNSKQIYTFHICGAQPYGCCYRYSPDDGNSWTNWLWLGYPSSSPLSSSQPSTATGPDGKLYVFCVGTDGTCYYKSLYSGNWDTNWTSIGKYLPSNPVALTLGNKLYVACRGGDNSVYYKVFYNNAWYPNQNYWYNLGGQIRGDPNLSSVCGTLYISVRGLDNGLWYKTTTDGFNWDTNWINLGGFELTDPSMMTI